MNNIDWQLIEDDFYMKSCTKVTKVFEQNNEKIFYAIAFHQKYTDMEVFYAPTLAMNALTKESSEDNLEWNAPDWVFPELDIDVENSMKDVLIEAMKVDSEKHWEKIEKEFDQMILNVLNRLYENFKSTSFVSDGFIAFYEELDNEEVYLRETVPPELFKKYFPYFDKSIEERNRIDALPIHEQVECYFSYVTKYDILIGTDEAEEKLIALKDDALPILIENLSSDKHGWKCASVLGKIGIATEKVLLALREDVHKNSHSTMWSAKALGLLGDIGFLAKYTEDEVLQKYVLGGIATMYQSWVNYCQKPLALDFTLLEKILREGSSKSKQILEEELSLGRGYRCIKEIDIDEALRGLDSSFLLIRQLSVCFLEKNSLDKKEAKRVLPKLVSALKDNESEIRRLALISMSCWKKEAFMYVAEIEKLLEDSNIEVKETAVWVLQKVK